MPIERPCCPNCQTRMRVVRTKAGRAAADLLTFGCRHCKNVRKRGRSTARSSRRLFIAASRIPAHAFARQSWPGPELFVIVSPCERSNRGAPRRDKGTGPQGRGVNARQRESDLATMRQLLLSLKDRARLVAKSSKGWK